MIVVLPRMAFDLKYSVSILLTQGRNQRKVEVGDLQILGNFGVILNKL